MPKTYPGGFNGDLINAWYQTSSAVLEDTRPPIISAIFVGFYIFIEARPKGSTFLKDISNSFFRKR